MNYRSSDYQSLANAGAGMVRSQSAAYGNPPISNSRNKMIVGHEGRVKDINSNTELQSMSMSSYQPSPHLQSTDHQRQRSTNSTNCLVMTDPAQMALESLRSGYQVGEESRPRELERKANLNLLDQNFTMLMQ